MENNPEKGLQLQAQQAQSLSVFADVGAFESAQRMGNALSKSEFVPTKYQNNVANCMVAMELANRMNTSVLIIMQNMNPIHGKPAFSSQYLIASVNSCGQYTKMKWKHRNLGEITVGGVKVQNEECIAYATEKSSGDVLESMPVTVKMAIDEGWYGKNGSKWKTMQHIMLEYRAASFWVSVYAPELKMGMPTIEEAEDIGAEIIGSQPLQNTGSQADAVADLNNQVGKRTGKRGAKKNAAQDSNIQDAQFEESKDTPAPDPAVEPAADADEIIPDDDGPNKPLL
jgi:hypothetical protein